MVGTPQKYNDFFDAAPNGLEKGPIKQIQSDDTSPAQNNIPLFCHRFGQKCNQCLQFYSRPFPFFYADRLSSFTKCSKYICIDVDIPILGGLFFYLFAYYDTWHGREKKIPSRSTRPSHQNWGSFIFLK